MIELLILLAAALLGLVAYAILGHLPKKDAAGTSNTASNLTQAAINAIIDEKVTIANTSNNLAVDVIDAGLNSLSKWLTSDASKAAIDVLRKENQSFKAP